MAPYTHYKTYPPPLDRTKARAQGERQAEQNLERYHYLRAAATKAYDIEQLQPGDHKNPNPMPFMRQGLVFDRYRLRNLKPLRGMKLHPFEDGSIHPGDIKMYIAEFFGNWKVREAGIMYAIMEQRPFWNMMLNYHSPAGTTGVPAWDKLFKEWEASGFPKNMIQCMYFARESGCLDSKCPFQHDTETTKRDKDLVYAWRRAQCGQLTQEDIKAIRDVIPSDYSPGDAGYIIEEIQRYIKDPDPPTCWNAGCRRVEDQPEIGQLLQRCSRCKVVTYCSADCQKKHWREHKKDCHPYEQIILDDELWSRMGTRKGLQRSGNYAKDDREGITVSISP
ncbi:hypothetical protein PENSPDRAFT_688564 [Peniophora sp. CONT]|nr:hypothetical protein PENSPDRAFT_688564 [Peniophora sp. CONT]